MWRPTEALDDSYSSVGDGLREERGCACAAVDHCQRRTSAHPFAFVDRCRRRRSARPCAAVDRCLGTPSAAAVDGRGEACVR